MPIALDAVQPSSSGQRSTTTPLAWTHTAAASGVVILVVVNLDGNMGSTPTMTATCDGTAMTSLGTETTSAGSAEGFVQAWISATGLASGAHSISVAGVTSGGTENCMVGGSLSFTGYAGTGTVAFANTDSTPSIAVPSNTSGNIIAGWIVCGNTVNTTVSPATSRIANNVTGNSVGATGNLVIATSPATGSSVTVAWTESGTSNALMAVEMQGTAGTDSSAGYATSASDLGGGSGTWASTGNADGTPDATYAVWTAP